MLRSCKASMDAGVKIARQRQEADREKGLAVRSFYLMDRFLRASIYHHSQAADARTFIRLAIFQSSNGTTSDSDFDSPFILSLSPITDLILFAQKGQLKLVLSTADFGVLILDLSACFNGLDKTGEITEKHILRRIDCSFSSIFMSPSNTMLAGIDSDGFGISLIDLFDELKPVSSISSLSDACDSIKWREDGLVFVAYSSFAPTNIYFCESRGRNYQRLAYPYKDDRILVAVFYS